MASQSGSLPAARTRLIGRDAELLAIHDLVIGGDARLVTCIGAGGSGKTSLALEVGRRVGAEFPDGVWLVELAPLSHPELVASAVASAIGVQEGSARTLLDGVVHHLQGRRLVLLLDNCEHLIDVCAQLADYLLSHCPDLRILATSREPLRISGEQLWRVSSLEFPSADRPHTVADLAFGT